MRILKVRYYCIFIGLVWGLLTASASLLKAQSLADSSKLYQLQIREDLPLEKMLQEQEAKIYVANRNFDSLRNIALSVNILTKENIRQSGVSNIPEALQLLPEFIVRPKTNGLYDVSYRGIASAYQHASAGQLHESLMLLINAVPFNDALTGEIRWEAIPLSIEDIERIEIIRSPQGSWYGYGGAASVINIVTIKSKNILGTQLKANLQLGQFRSHRYHGNVNIGINDKLAVRVGGFYQSQHRFQEQYYIRSAGRYVSSDSLRFYQPEASQTHVFSELALLTSAFHASSAYHWGEGKQLNIEAGMQNTQAQSLFLPSDEILISNREEQRRWANLHFATPRWRSIIYHQSGNRDFATGYAGWQYRNARTGIRLEHLKTVGRYKLLFGTEWTQDQMSPDNSLNNRLILKEGVLPLSEAWSQLLGSLYFQQTATFANNSLHLSSSQRVYQSLQDISVPFGFHLAAKWFLKKNTALQASASRVFQTVQRLYIDTLQISNTANQPSFGNALSQDKASEVLQSVHGLNDSSDTLQLRNIQAQQMLNYTIGIQQYWTNRGMFGLSAFMQEEGFQATPGEYMPRIGATFEGRYKVNRWTIRGHVSRLMQEDHVYPFYPDWTGMLSCNFTTFFDRLNVYTDFTYYGEHYQQADAQYRLPAQWFVNTKLIYKVWDQYSVYINGRNLLNRKDIAIPFADQNHRLISIGMNMAL